MKKNKIEIPPETIKTSAFIKFLSILSLLTTALFILGTISFDAHDLSEIAMPVNESIQNFLGLTGAIVVSEIYNYLGAGAYFLFFAITCFSFFALLNIKPETLKIRVMSAIFGVIALSAFLSQFNAGFIPSAPTAGGILGFTVYQLFASTFGILFTHIILIFFIVAGTFISTDVFFIEIISTKFKSWAENLEEVEEDFDADENNKKNFQNTQELDTFVNDIPVQISGSDKETETIVKQVNDTEKDKKHPVFLKNFMSILKNKKNSPGDSIPEEIRITDSDLGIENSEFVINQNEHTQRVKQSPEESFEVNDNLEEPMNLSNELQWKAEPYIKNTENLEFKIREKSRKLQELTYQLPDKSMLSAKKDINRAEFEKEVRENAMLLQKALKNYNIEGWVQSISRGPTVSMYEIELASGSRISRLKNISSEIAMVLRAPSVRIVAPIPGKSTIGIEVPNKMQETVSLKELLTSDDFDDKNYELPTALGLSSVGKAVFADLAKMPHLLIAGTTGSGKSVAANVIISSLIFTRKYEQVKFVMIDPKMVEFAPYRNIPHLLFPVVTEVSKAPDVLAFLVEEMENRYKLLERTLCKNLKEYNELSADERIKRIRMNGGFEDDLPSHIPYIVTFIDELADLMMVAGKEIEMMIVRLAQKSRAIGIHLVIATQRPSVDVITGLIKANIPSRISFRVLSQIDSRTIIDRVGAEKLLGKGDMLFMEPGSSDLVRIQNAFVTNEEILNFVSFVKQQAQPSYQTIKIYNPNNAENLAKDEEFIAAAEIITKSQKVTISYLTQSLGIGVKKAKEIMGKLEDFGVIEPKDGTKGKIVAMTTHEFYEKIKNLAA